jgi:hypothetical protein
MLLAIGQHVNSQNWTNTKNNIWQELNETTKAKFKIDFNWPTEEINLIQLDIKALKNSLKNAPKRQFGSAFSEKIQQVNSILQMPMPDGSWLQFQVMELSVMHPDLAIKFPQIKSYKGIGITDPTATIYFDISKKGFHGVIFSGKKNMVFIDPLNSENNDLYKIYFKNDAQKNNDWNCHFSNDTLIGDKTKNNTLFKSGLSGLKTFRIAIACTGEYAQYHGGTKELALAAINTTLTRLNGIFERDLSVFLQLVPNNDLLIYLNPYSDPFTNNDGGKLLTENQSVCDDLLGDDGYDIGHIFSTHGGGLAQYRSVCKNGLKAQGATGSAVPEGDSFDIDYVAHEIGHQFGANHTQNNDCNRHIPTAVEPGSGSSIMGYAGICFPNIQTNSDAYFHAISIEEINSFLEIEGGQCMILEEGNYSITADAGPDYFIPKSTPFKLVGNAFTELPNEQLIFNWEQFDNQVSLMPPSSQNNIGPLFRSYPPTSFPERYFPNLNSIIRNELNMWEVLPGCEREMHFTFSVRGSHLEFGCNDSDNMNVSVVDNAGPFKIINTANLLWIAGTEKEIFWDVAGTNISPINCSKVDVLLSTDGGYTYPIELASNVINDGAQKIIVPNVNTDRARIMVKSVGNIFFDISDSDFSINTTTPFIVSLDVMDVKCRNEKNGSIRATPLGGNGEYEFLWSNGQTGNSLNNLAAGNYQVTVYSGYDVAVASAVLRDPSPIKIEFVLNGSNNSHKNILTAFTSGGTGEFNYLWNNGSENSFIEIATIGNYSVTVTDGNQCSFAKSFFADEMDLETEENVGNSNLTSRPNNNKYIHVYPNPSSGIFQIEFYQLNQGGPEIFVYDLLGREMMNHVLLQRKAGIRSADIDLTNLKSGCYILQIREGQLQKNVKIVKI